MWWRTISTLWSRGTWSSCASMSCTESIITAVSPTGAWFWWCPRIFSSKMPVPVTKRSFWTLPWAQAIRFPRTMYVPAAYMMLLCGIKSIRMTMFCLPMPLSWNPWWWKSCTWSARFGISPPRTSPWGLSNPSSCTWTTITPATLRWTPSRTDSSSPNIIYAENSAKPQVSPSTNISGASA